MRLYDAIRLLFTSEISPGITRRFFEKLIHKTRSSLLFSKSLKHLDFSGGFFRYFFSNKISEIKHRKSAKQRPKFSLEVNKKVLSDGREEHGAPITIREV